MDQTTYDMLVEAVQIQLETVATANTETKEGKEALAKTIHLVEVLNETDRINYEYDDKEKRRIIEEKRNEAMNEIERDKQKLTWGRVGLEMAKVVVPLLMTLAGYNVFQKRVMTFEQTGRVASTAGRELHLPKIMK